MTPLNEEICESKNILHNKYPANQLTPWSPQKSPKKSPSPPKIQEVDCRAAKQPIQEI